MKSYYKVWFANGKERTAGLIFDTDRVPLSTSVGTYSTYFPYSEAPKMRRFHRSELYPTWTEAFDVDTEVTK